MGQVKPGGELMAQLVEQAQSPLPPRPVRPLWLREPAHISSLMAL